MSKSNGIDDLAVDSTETLEETYSIIAELWCSPPEVDTDRKKLVTEAERVIEKLLGIDEAPARLLSCFVAEYPLSEEEYIDLFELEPKCPLYLGSHSFDEPQTCAGAAVSDRNEYMIELVGIYRHFRQMPNGKELPDYLPLMVDFLSLTAGSKDDPVRGKYIAEYVLPYLPPMRSRLEELKTPYLHLLDAMEKVINTDLKTQQLPKQKDESHVG